MTHYDGWDLTDEIAGALRSAGLDPEHLSLDDLAPLDEFHALGRPATLALAELAQIAEGDRVLDVGAGIGGPARLLADRFGAQVTALDPTERFCAADEMLCRATGLADRVSVVRGDALALPFEDASFDVAWTQHVAMSIEDKAGMYAEMRRVLAPGGRVAIFDVVAGPGGPIHFPVPWADGPEASFLVSPDELLELLRGAGLEVRTANDGQAALAAVSLHPAIEAAPGAPTLKLVMPDFEERMRTMVRNLQEQRTGLMQVVAVA